MWPYFGAAEVEGCCAKSLQKFGLDGYYIFHMSWSNCELSGRVIIRPACRGSKRVCLVSYIIIIFDCSVLGDLELENCTLGCVSWAYGWQYDSGKMVGMCWIKKNYGWLYEVGNMGWPGLWLAARLTEWMAVWSVPD